MHSTPVSLLDQLGNPANQDAWRRLVKLYTPLLSCWVRRFGLRPQDLPDVIQDVFAVLVAKLPEFAYDRHKSFRGWLWTITLNKCRDLLRHTASAPPAGPNGLSSLDFPDGTLKIDDAEYGRYVVGQALKIMQAEFQPATWRAFWETQVHDRLACEVAAELGMTVDAVYTAKSRVLRRLRQELRGLLE